MKKSLSAILATSMVASMFASVAFAAEAPKTAQEMFDVLKTKGIFEGINDKGDAGLDQKMNRAQVSKILVKLMGLSEDEAGAAGYKDLTVETWAKGYIGAATKAGLMEGTATAAFDPAGTFTTEQLAAVMVRALKLEQSTDKVEGKVSDWAKGYVAAAVKAGLIAKTADYSAPALREVLVTTAFAAQDKIVPVGKVSLAEVKPTGVKTVEVKFNKPVDTAAAKLELKKGSVAVATTTKFADDKKSAVLTLTDVKLGEGTYNVTLSGLAADQVDKTKVEFTAENEKVSKIDFVSANDTLAKADKVILKLKATNQYGENASTSAGSYTVYAGTNNDVYVKLAKAENGDLLLTLDTDLDNATGNAQQTGRYISGVSLIPINVYHNDTRVTVSKNFKLGTAPFGTKMEVTAIKYSNGKDALSGMGETATFDVVNYDQYGNVMPSTASDRSNTRVILNAYEPAFAAAVIDDSNSDDVTDVKISLSSNLDKNGEYTYTVYNQAGSATAKIAVKAGKVATKLELGEMTDVIAAGDEEAFIPLIGYDANGTQLTVDELVSAQNVARIKLSTGATLETAGEKKGKIKVTSIPTQPKSVVSVTASITEVNASSFVSKTYNVSDVRIPDSITVATDPAKKAVAGAESNFKFIVKDQYGVELKKTLPVATSGSVAADSDANASKYRVNVTHSTYGTGLVAYNKETKVNFAAGNTYFTGSDLEKLVNKEHRFNALNTMSSDAAAEFAIVIEKSTNNGGTWTEITSKITKRIEAIKATDELTYNVTAVADLFNAIDSASVVSATYDTDAVLLDTVQEDPKASKLRREVVVTATDAAGNKVALPAKVKSVTTSNPQVAVSNVVAGSTNGVTTSKGYVIGNKKGSASLNVLFETHKGETLLKTVAVNVKDDVITSTKIEAGNKSKTYKAVSYNGADAADLTALPATLNAFTDSVMKAKVTDNYGVTYEALDAQKYNYLFGVVFTVKNVVGGDVKVDQYGNLTLTGNVTSFEVNATTAAGFTASTFVVIKR